MDLACESIAQHNIDSNIGPTIGPSSRFISTTTAEHTETVQRIYKEPEGNHRRVIFDAKPRRRALERSQSFNLRAERRAERGRRRAFEVNKLGLESFGLFEGWLARPSQW